MGRSIILLFTAFLVGVLFAYQTQKSAGSAIFHAVPTLIAIRLKIQTKSSHKIHISELLRLDFVNLNSWIAIISQFNSRCQSRHLP